MSNNTSHHKIWDIIKQLGYLPFEKEKEYDFALSFAGENRNIAMALKCELEKKMKYKFFTMRILKGKY